jgi:hypothetical protein
LLYFIKDALFELTTILLLTWSWKKRECQMFAFIQLQCIDSMIHLIEWVFKWCFREKSFANVMIQILENHNDDIVDFLILMRFIYINSISCKFHVLSSDCLFEFKCSFENINDFDKWINDMLIVTIFCDDYYDCRRINMTCCIVKNFISTFEKRTILNSQWKR